MLTMPYHIIYPLGENKLMRHAFFLDFDINPAILECLLGFGNIFYVKSEYIFAVAGSKTLEEFEPFIRRNSLNLVYLLID